jgi:DNA-binding IclR family transcriptional regulator
MAEPAPSGSIQVLSRAIAVLRALEGHADGLSLSALAERTGLPRSSVHRLATALEVEGFVAPASPNGRIRLGAELVRLGESVRPNLRALLHPTMERLFDQLHETVDLAVLDADHLRFIDQIAAPHRLRAVSAVGATFPLHCTANGKAVLALMPDETVNALVPARPARHTETTLVTRKALLADLAEIRRTHVAFDREEHTDGISAAGFAVRDQLGGYAAISVPMPTARFRDREAEIVAAVTAARDEAVEALNR